MRQARTDGTARRAAMALSAGLALLGALPGPAGAQGAAPGRTAPQDAFPLPEGCEALLTVQMRGCYMANHFRCEADPEGVQRYVTFGGEGARGASVVDAEFQWLESYGTERRERLGDDVADRASLSELFETGTDTYDFPLVDEGGEAPRTERVVGVDQLTGESVTIDGEPLERTTFEMRRVGADGEEIVSVRGAQFVSRERRLFFAGTETVSVDGRTIEIDHTPMAFIEPGEPGFFATAPLYGCETTDISFEAD